MFDGYTKEGTSTGLYYAGAASCDPLIAAAGATGVYYFVDYGLRHCLRQP